jgi:serine/threonine protein kinase
MDERDLLRFTLGMAEGVAYLHQTGIVHGDLKSPNVLVCGEFCINLNLSHAS